MFGCPLLFRESRFNGGYPLFVRDFSFRVTAAGSRRKVLHRARFGISVLKELWGMGIGRMLMESCIDCARRAGYTQLELEVVADNERAMSLYRRAGFVEYGRNPRGYWSSSTGFQELVHMRLEL